MVEVGGHGGKNSGVSIEKCSVRGDVLIGVVLMRRGQ